MCELTLKGRIARLFQDGYGKVYAPGTHSWGRSPSARACSLPGLSPLSAYGSQLGSAVFKCFRSSNQRSGEFAGHWRLNCNPDVHMLGLPAEINTTPPCLIGDGFHGEWRVGVGDLYPDVA